MFSVYQKWSVAQLENELQKFKVQFQPEHEFKVTKIDIINETIAENTSVLDSFPPDLFTGIHFR